MTLLNPKPCSAICAAGVGASNVIPNSVELLGTIRALTPSHFGTMRRRVDEVTAAIAAAHGCSAEVAWSERPYVPTVNDAGMAKLVHCSKLVPTEGFRDEVRTLNRCS